MTLWCKTSQSKRAQSATTLWAQAWVGWPSRMENMRCTFEKKTTHENSLDGRSLFCACRMNMGRLTNRAITACLAQAVRQVASLKRNHPICQLFGIGHQKNHWFLHEDPVRTICFGILGVSHIWRTPHWVNYLSLGCLWPSAGSLALCLVGPSSS